MVSLDILPKFTPTICCDILRWDYRAAFPAGRFDFVWASPVCAEHSQALTTRPRRLHEGDALVLRAIEIIAYLAPRLWAIENPQTGLLKTRPFMQRLGFVDATYCLYGTPFKKQTRFWTNMRWAPSCGLCGPGNRCEAWENGRHARAAQRGPRKIGQRYENVRRQSRELLYGSKRDLTGKPARPARKARGRCQGWKHSDFYIKKSKVRPRDRHRKHAETAYQRCRQRKEWYAHRLQKQVGVQK